MNKCEERKSELKNQKMIFELAFFSRFRGVFEFQEKN
jgi:hypothetical protein